MKTIQERCVRLVVVVTATPENTAKLCDLETVAGELLQNAEGFRFIRLNFETTLRAQQMTPDRPSAKPKP